MILYPSDGNQSVISWSRLNKIASCDNIQFPKEWVETFVEMLDLN